MSCLAPGLGSLAGCRQGRVPAALGTGRGELSAAAGPFFGAAQGWRPAWWELCAGRGMVPGPETEREPGCAPAVPWHCRGRAPRAAGSCLFGCWGIRGGHGAAVGMALGLVETGKRECLRRVWEVTRALRTGGTSVHPLPPPHSSVPRSLAGQRARWEQSS